MALIIKINIFISSSEIHIPSKWGTLANLAFVRTIWSLFLNYANLCILLLYLIFKYEIIITNIFFTFIFEQNSITKTIFFNKWSWVLLKVRWIANCEFRKCFLLYVRKICIKNYLLKIHPMVLLFLTKINATANRTLTISSLITAKLRWSLIYSIDFLCNLIYI